MSDTPIDESLDVKTSTRYPEFMDERIGEFRDEYNAKIRDLPLDDAVAEAFVLDSESDARRRLLDMGMSYWVEHGTPFGFSFDPEQQADGHVSCPECGEDDPWLFRLAVDPDQDDPADGPIDFSKTRCLSCGTTNPLHLVATPGVTL